MYNITKRKPIRGIFLVRMQTITKSCVHIISLQITLSVDWDSFGQFSMQNMFGPSLFTIAYLL